MPANITRLTKYFQFKLVRKLKTLYVLILHRLPIVPHQTLVLSKDGTGLKFLPITVT